jgi:hypothetical protein
MFPRNGERSDAGLLRVRPAAFAAIFIVAAAGYGARPSDGLPPIWMLRGAVPVVNCTGGAKLAVVLHLPKATGGQTPRLVGGVVWVGRHYVAAADTQAVLRWSFGPAARGLPVTLFSDTKARFNAALFGYGHRLLALAARPSAAAAVAALLSSAAGPPKGQRVPHWNLTGGAGGSPIGWWSAAAPPTLGWIAATSNPANGDDGLLVWLSGRGAQADIQLRLGEPSNTLFTSKDGKYLGWVDGGHRVRWIKPSHRQAVVIHSLRLRSAGGLRFGAFSPHGRRLLLVASHTSTGGGVELISVRRRAPKSEHTLRLWPPDGGAVCPCPPVYSRSGKIASVATFRYGHRSPVGIFITGTRSVTTRCYIRLRGDLPVAMAFSPNGSKLAVEGWYHVFIFRMPKKFRSPSHLRFHEPHWSADWHSPSAPPLPPQ